MKSNELRIGNWIQFRQETGGIVFVMVDMITPYSFEASGDEIFHNEKYDEDYQSIPLTPEILEKAGFVQHHDDCHLQPIYIKKIFGNPPFVWGVYPEVLGGGVVINDAMQLQYLHQLQNLYFALTGEELPIEL